VDRCLIVKTDSYTHEQVAQVVQLRATTEGMALGSGVLEKIAEQGERASLRSVRDSTFLLPALMPVLSRYALQLLAPAAILATLAGRSTIEAEDVGELQELFLDARSSAALISDAML
jgi:RuvB-like protein 1 (pontin 52)